uniref:Uncharacterized protein n=1 Tax=mine drainage metagenome TaxID=410659 RepID=E6PGA6_9ZZZZ
MPVGEGGARASRKARYNGRKGAFDGQKRSPYTQLSQQVWRAYPLDVRAFPCLYSLSRLPPIGGLFNVHLGATPS